MLTPNDLAEQIRMQRTFFERATRCFTEEHSGFSPVEGMMSVAQQVAHAAHTLEWFREGAFRPEGFDMNFEAHAKEIMAVTSLAEARKWFTTATDDLANFLASKSMPETMVWARLTGTFCSMISATPLWTTRWNRLQNCWRPW